MTVPAYSTNEDTSWLADISAGLNIYGDLSRNTTKGDVQAGATAARTLGKGSGLGEAGGVVTGALEIQQGLQRGGVLGYSEAGLGAGQIGVSTGEIGAGSAAAKVIPVAGAALATYEFAKNWRSGSTGADAMGGASSGAAIGTAIEPGLGTLVGTLAGAAVGAVSSMFGPGRQDPETANWNQYAAYYDQHGAAAVSGATPSQNFQLLAGIFDSRGGGANSIPFYAKYGRMGEAAFTSDMATQINHALASGKISKSTPPSQVYSTVVLPWINGMVPGGNMSKVGKTSSGQATQGAINNMLTSLVGQYMSGQLTSQSKLGIAGQTIPTLAPVGALGVPPDQAKIKAHVGAVTQQYNQPVAAFPGASGAAGASGASAFALLFPALFAGASMALPTSTTNAPTSQPGTPADPTGSGGGSSDPGFLSDLGSFFSNNAGTLAEFGTLAGLGIAEAGSQKKTNDQLAGSLAAPGQPFTAAGSAELSQLEGGPQMGGPLGASIAQQTGAAANLGKVAQEYSTGALTPAQSSQVQDYIKQQRAMVDTQLAQSGNTDSSARQAAYQQIDDNAAQLTQSLTTQNTSLASAALTSVQQTYSTLLGQALSSSEFGFSTQEAAVMTQIQSDTQLSQSLQQLFAGIAQGLGNAIGGGNKPGGGGGGGGGNTAGQVGKAVAGAVKGVGGGSGVAGSASGGGGGFDPNQNTSATGIQDPSNNPEYSGIDQPFTNLQGGYSDYSGIQDPATLPSDPFTGGVDYSTFDPFGGD